jgi:hypothetical protein
VQLVLSPPPLPSLPVSRLTCARATWATPSFRAARPLLRGHLSARPHERCQSGRRGHDRWLATTYTGLLLSNPINSTVNLVLEKVGIAFLVVFAAAAGFG